MEGSDRRPVSERRLFYQYVLPSIVAFALSGVYAIVDGFFVGNMTGDLGLSAINVAYPVVALLQSVGTGIGMGAAVYYSIHLAEGDEARARGYLATAWWLLVLASAVLTVGTYAAAGPIMRLFGAQGAIHAYGTEYLRVIALGAALQILGVGLVPCLRNYGGAVWAMVAMVAGFVTNIALDWLFVWVYDWGMTGAALATDIGQGATVLIAVVYALRKGRFYLRLPRGAVGETFRGIVRIGLAPFGLTLTPNLSLVLVNRFSAAYGGEPAIAAYACIAYIICIIYLVLQGVGDGCQPLMSRYYGEGRPDALRRVRAMAYRFALLLAVVGGAALFLGRDLVGPLFGTSPQVGADIAAIVPIFLVSVPFVAVTRIATASFYATEKSVLSYLLTFLEPAAMLAFLLVLPAHCGGQPMVWWSVVLARIVSAVLAMALTRWEGRRSQQRVELVQ